MDFTYILLYIYKYKLFYFALFLECLDFFFLSVSFVVFFDFSTFVTFLEDFCFGSFAFFEDFTFVFSFNSSSFFCFSASSSNSLAFSEAANFCFLRPLLIFFLIDFGKLSSSTISVNAFSKFERLAPSGTSISASKSSTFVFLFLFLFLIGFVSPSFDNSTS